MITAPVLKGSNEKEKKNENLEKQLTYKDIKNKLNTIYSNESKTMSDYIKSELA